MPISTTWVNPSAAGTLDLATGAILTEAWCDGVASDLLRLGGTTGTVTQVVVGVTTAAAASTASTSLATLSDPTVSITTLAGSVLVCFGSLTVSSSVQATNQLWLTVNTVSAAGGPLIWQQAVAGFPTVVTGFALNTNTTAGVQVVQFSWLTSSGTLTRTASSGGIIAVELRR